MVIVIEKEPDDPISNLDETVGISLRVNTLVKGMNQSTQMSVNSKSD